MFTDSKQTLKHAIVLACVFYFVERVFSYTQLEKVNGTVVSLPYERVGSFKSGPRRSARHYYPTVEYKIDTTTYRYAMRLIFFASHFEEGETVSLLVDRDEPENAMLNSLYRFFFPLQRVLLFSVLLMGLTAFIVVGYAVFPPDDSK